jgi:2-keto-4-pentenoate hydratase
MKSSLCIAAVLATTLCAAQELPAPVDKRSSDREIMEHMYRHEANQTQTDALAVHFPHIDRDRAYGIQKLRLEEKSKQYARAGWKLAWTRMPEDGQLDPAFGHYLEDRVFPAGEPVSAHYFTLGTALAEPEIVFYFNKDLPGPVVTRDEVIDAIDSVGIAMEFVNWRTLEPRSREHAIIDNGIAAGVVLGELRFALGDVSFADELGTITINGGDSSAGPATSIMGEDPLAAVVWAANELPRYGMHFKAGEFVVSGSVCIPLPVSAGDTAVASFTNLGSLEVNIVD